MSLPLRIPTSGLCIAVCVHARGEGASTWEHARVWSVSCKCMCVSKCVNISVYTCVQVYAGRAFFSSGQVGRRVGPGQGTW